MEGMSARVVVVEYDFYDLIVLQDVWIRVDAVYGSIVGKCSGGEGSIEGRDGRGNIGDFVEECATVASQLRSHYLGRKDAY